PRKPGSSSFWAHFDLSDRDKARCRNCGVEVSRKRGTTSCMRSHIRTKHKELFMATENDKTLEAFSTLVDSLLKSYQQ
ncbi:hypothetical protein PFISCL1PPCAC_13677, partial [Pristionchus fissidentatus]